MENVVKKSWLKTYLNRRMLTVFLLGFSSGLPLALVGGTLQAWFKSGGASIALVGYMSLVTQPYVFKFLWAPLLDKFAPTASMDKRRGWILIMQVAIIIMVVLMALTSPDEMFGNIPLLFVLAFVLSTFSATQDIAIDAYRVEILRSDERGLGSALGVEGYRVAMIASGAFALYMAAEYGWQVTYLVMASMMLIGIVTTYFAPTPNTTEVAKDTNVLALALLSFKDFLKRDKAWLLLLLVVTYKLSDAFAHTLTTPFLMDMAFTLKEIALINKSVGMVATLIGIMVGGLFMTRVGLFKALLTFGILSAVTNLCYMYLAMIGKDIMIASGAVFIENICAGMGTAAFVALIMSLCSSKYTATQFALLSALSAVGRIYVGPIAGHLVESYGWTDFYLFTAVIALPILALLIYLRGEISGRDIDADKQGTMDEDTQDAIPAPA